MKKAEYPVSKTIKSRRTIRVFTKEAVSKELITELLETSSMAPNHKMREPWRFAVYTGSGTRVLAYAVTSVPTRGIKTKMDPPALRKYLEDIPCHIVVIAPESPILKEREEDFAPASALIQNFQLAAWERGLGVVWKTDEYLCAPEFRTLTGIQPGERAVGLLHVGYPQNIPSISVRTPITEKIVFFETDTGIQIPDVFRFKAEDKNVLWNLPSMTKEDAITCAGEKLKELGYADDYFVQSMHEKEGFKNTYLGNGVATPHGSKVAKEKVRISGAVILHFPEGISYENETVYIMIAIAAQKYIHMQILSTAVKICENENHVYNLRTSNSKESFIELFNQFSMG